MATPVRYPSGITNVKPKQALANLPMPSKTRLHYHFDDFDILHKVAQLGLWTTVSDGGGSGSIALADADGGTILLTPGNTDKDTVQMYNANENFTVESGKKMWFGIRMKGTAADPEDLGVQVGLAQAKNTAVSVTSANWIGFISLEGDGEVDFGITASGSRVKTTLDVGADLEAAFHTYEWEFDGKSTFKVFVDGVHVASHTTTGFPTTEMGKLIGLYTFSKSLSATLTVDWIYAAKERTNVND